MDLSITIREYGGDNLSWLGSAHGTNAARTITLDLSSGFDTASFYSKGFLPSGLPVTKLASGKYGLYKEDSETELAGFILTTQPLPSLSSTPIAAPLLEHGRVIEKNLPVTIPAKAKTEAAGRIIFA